MSQPVPQPYTSPYHEFCREQRPLLPPLTNSDREKKIGQMWKELSEAGRAVYKQGLTQLASSGRGGLRAWAHPAPPEFGACGVLPSANRPALPTKLQAPPSAAGSAKFLAGCEVAQSIAIPVRASVAQLGGTYQTFVTQGGFRKPPMVLAQSTSSKAALERLDATLPVQERSTFWAAPERAAKTSPPSAAPENFHAMPAAPTLPSPRVHVVEEVHFRFPWVEAAGRTASAPKRAAPPGPATAPRAKIAAFTSPYNEFCKFQRSLLPERPLPHQHKDREKLLGGLS